MREYKGERSDFSNRLREARTARGLTQEQLAKIADINVKTISRWELYKKYPTNPKESVETLRAIHVFKIAQALDVTPEYLIYGNDNMDIYMNQIESELKALTADEIRYYRYKPLTDKVLAHLKLTDEFVNEITTYWYNNTLKCRRYYVQETIIRYCHNRPIVKPIKINETTWRFEDKGVRFFLHCGKEKAALIDTGMNVPNAKKLAETVTNLPIILINTHADPDHLSGNIAFEKFYMNPKEEENYRNNGGKGEIIPIKDGDIIDLGERPLRIIDIPGHTPGSIAILDEKYRVLIAGDSVQDGNIFMFGKYRKLDVYIDSLERLKKYEGKYDEIYAMHGTLPERPELIDKLIEGANKIRNGVADGKKVEMFGREVMLYKFSYAGFLCDLPRGGKTQ